MLRCERPADSPLGEVFCRLATAFWRVTICASSCAAVWSHRLWILAKGFPFRELGVRITVWDLVQSLNLGPIWQASDSLSPRAPGPRADLF